LALVGGLGEDPTAARDDRVRSQHDGVGVDLGDCPRFGACEPTRDLSRQLPF
jgi:hypothetical protein